MDEILTDEVKEELLEILPESALDCIDGYCVIYLDHKEVRPSMPKEERQHLEELSTAVEEAQEALVNVLRVSERIPPSLRKRVQKQYKLLGALKLWDDIIKEATRPVMAPLGKMLKNIVIPKRTGKDSERLLVRLLIYDYKRMTGKEPYREKGESGPIHRIVAALNPVLNCGSLAGIIREELKSYKDLPKERRGGFMVDF